MKSQATDFLRADYANLEIQEAITKPVSVLLGVSADAKDALDGIGIKSIFDLGSSWIFSNAKAAINLGKINSPNFKLGLVPADLLKPTAQYSSLDKIGELEVKFLNGITNVEGEKLSKALDVENIRDFSMWPPYLAASKLVRKASGSTFDDLVSDEADELRPKFGEYPTERVYYDTLVMLQMKEEGDKELDKPVSLKPTLESKNGFNKIAIGVQLTIMQSWYAQGVTLGQMLHSLALAPGEATRIAVVGWERRTKATSSESIEEKDQLDSNLIHTRSIHEVQQGVANELQMGGSRSQSESSSTSGSAALTVGTGFVPSLFVDAEASGSIQTASTNASSDSTAWSVGNKSTFADMTQNVNDTTEQHSTSTRNRRASAVREVSQSEHEQVSTRIVANYNHMHALTIQYYEVVQIYRVATQIRSAQRCLFVPLELITFEGDDAWEWVERFRGILIRAALTRQARNLLFDDTTTVAIKPSANIKVSSNRPELFSASQFLISPVSVTNYLLVDGGKPSGKEKQSSKAQGQMLIWNPNEISAVSSILGKSIIRPDSDNLYFPDNTEIVGISFKGFVAKDISFDFANPDTPDSTRTIPTDLSSIDIPPGSIRIIDLLSVNLSKLSEQPTSGSMTLHFSYMGRRFNAPEVPVYLASGTAPQQVLTFQNDQADRRKELLAHLKANYVHYSQAIFRNLDTPTIVMLLSRYKWNDKPLSQQVEPKPLTVIGNYLIFKAPVEADEKSGVEENGENITWENLLKSRGIKFEESDQRLIPIPTAGVFAEAVLGRSNSAEKLDITRFWNWQDSPIPLQPTEIAPVQMGSRATTEDLKPGQLSSPIVNILNPSSLPDPAGLSATLNALANGNMFRDMSGLAGTQGLTDTAMSGTLNASTAAGEITAENLRTHAQKAVAMAQVASDIVKAAMGVPSTGSSVQGISGDGARINHGKNMDDRSLSSANNNSKQDSENVEIEPSGNTTANSGFSNGQNSSTTMKGGYESAAFNKTNWGGLGASGAEIFDKVSDQSLFSQEIALAASSGKSKPPKNGEVTLLGNFVWEPPVDDVTEIQLFLQGKWHPTWLDFQVVTGVSKDDVMGGFQAILGEIAQFPDNSIKRVNFFTHANANVMGIAGENIPGDVVFTKHIDDTTINGFAANGISITYNNKTYTLAEIRKKFMNDAIFVLYACHLGANIPLLKALSDLLKVQVIGFKKKIIFCPPPQSNPPFKRVGMEIGINKTGNCAQDKVSDWRSLINDPFAIKVP